MGYKEIIDRDMFGFSNMDLDRATMLSRLNLHFKWGIPGFLPITLTDEEQGIANEIDAVETFDEMFALAKRLYTHEALQKEREEMESAATIDGPGDGDPANKPGEGRDGKGKPLAGRGDITDLGGAFSRKDGQKYNHTTITLSPVLNLNEQIASTDSIRTAYEKQGVPLNLDAYRKFVRESDSFVRQLVAQFERRKAADEIRRERPKQTGMLNLDRLHQFRTHDDIFLSKIVKQDGKNHGIMFLLDLSGSMAQAMGDCFQQVLQLVWFCEKAKIPFEVFGFTDGHIPGEEELYEKEYRAYIGSDQRNGFKYSRSPKFANTRVNGVVFDNTKIFNLASSRDSASKREELLCYLYETYVGGLNPRNRVIRLGNTPTVEAMILATQFMQKWVLDNDIQIPTLMVVTDGDPNGIHLHNQEWMPYNITPHNIITVNNEVTQTVHKLDGINNPGNFLNAVIGTMLDSLRSTINARCVGMYVGPKTLNEHLFRHFCVSPKEIEQQRNSAGFYSRDSITQSARYDEAVESYKGGAVLVHPDVYPGFDAFFLMRSPKIVSDSEAFADGGFAKVKSTFVKTMAKRGGCRVFLTKYVDIVAGQPIKGKGEALYSMPWRVPVGT